MVCEDNGGGGWEGRKYTLLTLVDGIEVDRTLELQFCLKKTSNLVCVGPGDIGASALKINQLDYIQ